jgi:hypothetical protein
MIYSIAGITVDLKFKYSYGEDKCKRYLSDGVAVFSAEATDEEIEKEHLLVPQNTVEMAEFDCVFRKLYNFVPKYNRMLVHGASIMMDGKAFLFLAPSGVGKSTHIKLWGKTYKNAVTVIDCDKPFVGFENNVPTVWGSPRTGKEGWNNPISAPLAGIAFLERGEENKIFTVSPNEIIDKAFAQFYIPKIKETAELSVLIMDNILNRVPLYRLWCNTQLEAAKIAYEGMNK